MRAAYNIPRDENLKLRDFPTLAHVIQFARDKQSSAATPAAPAPAVASAPSAATPVARPRPPVASFDAANRIPRRVPVPILRPPLDHLQANGRDAWPGQPRGDHARQRRRGRSRWRSACRRWVSKSCALEDALDANALTERLKTWLAAGPVQGVYWLPALDNEGDLSHMDLASWHEALQVRVKSLYTTMRILYEQIASAGHVPGLGHAARRTAWLRRRRSGRAAGRRGGGLHQDLQAGAHGSPRQSGRFRGRAQGVGSCRNFSSRKRCAIPAQSRSATRMACAGRSDCRNSPRRRPARPDAGSETAFS